MKSYNYLMPEDIDRENLVNNEDFLDDAASYIYKRSEGEVDLTDPDEIYDEFMERMRKHDVNELDTVSDYMYAQEADDEDKEEMSRLFSAYDKMEMSTEDFSKKVLNYGEGILTAPSTIAGLFTGGSAKVASVAGQTAMKALVRRIISGSVKAGVIEGVIGAGQNVGQQATRMELDPEREFSGTELAVTTAASALPGMVIGGAQGARKASQAIEAGELEKQAASALARAEATATENAAERIAKASKDNAEDLADAENVVKELKPLVSPKEKLDPLDPLRVEKGEEIKAGIEVEEGFEIVLSESKIEHMTAAILEMGTIVDRNKGERITAAISRGLGEGTVPKDIFGDIMEKYNLSGRDIGLILEADMSAHGRALQAMGQIKKKHYNQLKKLIDDAKNIAEQAGVGRESANYMNELAVEGNIQKLLNGLNKGERLRRTVMTSQPVTTVRNFFGGGARLTLDVFEDFVSASTQHLYNGLIKAAPKLANKFGLEKVAARSAFNSGDIAKYILNKPEAELIADMFREIDNEAYESFFQGFVDSSLASTKAGGGGLLERTGNFFNYLNKMSDNFYKKAAFAGELSRLTKAHYGKELVDIIKEGKFNSIDPKLFNEAMDKGFELLYQKTPKGTGTLAKAARGYLNIDKQYGFLTGLLIPFPRFVINQMQFMYEHVPLMGMLPLEKIGAEAGTKVNYADKFAKSVSGAGLIYSFYALRASQGEGTKWYNVIDDNGNSQDMRPFLGPMSLELYIADLMYRSERFGEDQPMPQTGDITREVIQTAVGSSLRAGTGLYLIDQAIPELLNTFDGERPTLASQRMLGRIVGDYLNTYSLALPVAVARDMYSLTDEELRKIPNTNRGVTMWDIIKLRATRSLGAFTGVEEERYDILSPEPTRKKDPLRTAVTGLNISRKPNAVEREATRLQVEPYELYRSFKFGPADSQIRKEVSQRLEPIMKSFIKTKEYQSLSDEDKVIQFIKQSKSIINEHSASVLDRLQEKVRDLSDRGVSQSVIRTQLGYNDNDINQFRYENMERRVQRSVEAELGAPTDDSNFAEYLQLAEAKKKLKLAEGGLVGDPLSLSETAEEEDVATRERSGEDYTKQMIELGLDLAPVTGEIRSAQAAVEDFEKGDYGMAALGALGAVPGVGMVARAGRKGAKALSKYADDLWDVPTQKITSADTSINSSKLPAGYSKLKDMDVFKPGQRVVDIGGGRFDNAVEDLAKQDVELQVYDPFNRAPEHNQVVKELVADGGADIAVSNNVLNVIEEPENIKRVVQQAENAIKPGDKAYFTIYQGDGKGVGRITKEKKNKDGTVEPKSYQRNEKTDAYVPRVEEVFGKGNVERKGDVIIATKNADTPPPATKVDAPKERTFKNEKGTTFKRGNKKYPVGKVVGNQVYFHKNYLDDMPKEAQDLYYKALEKLPEDHNFNTLMYEPASKGKPARIRFDESADFDTAREPTPGKYISIDDAGNVKSGKTDQIFHHKWMWVADDYPGFDVDNSYNWSKQWAQTLNKAPSGYKNKWEQELKDAGLPIEDTANMNRGGLMSPRK